MRKSSVDTGRRPARATLGSALAAAMAAGPLPLLSITSLAPLIAADLDLSTGRLGILAAISYGAAAVTAPFSGRLVDRLPGRDVLKIVFGGAVASIVLSATWGSFLGLAVAMAISGAAQSASNPVTNKLIALHVPSGRQGTIVGVKQSGVQLAQFFAGGLLPSLALLTGWRPAIGVSAALVLVSGGLALRVLPRARAERPPTEAPEEDPRPAAAPSMRGLAAYTLGNAMLVTTVNVHLPLYAHDEIGLGAALAGALSGVIGGVGILTRILWARAAERSTSFLGPLRVLATLSLTSVALMWGASAAGPLMLLAATVVFACSAIPGQAVAMFTVVRSASTDRTGSATGALMVGLYIGFMAGPLAFGLVTDAWGYAAGWLAAVGVGVLTVASVTVPGRRTDRATPRPQDDRTTR